MPRLHRPAIVFSNYIVKRYIRDYPERCHPERSGTASNASRPAQSKDPYPPGAALASCTLVPGAPFLASFARSGAFLSALNKAPTLAAPTAIHLESLVRPQETP